MFYCRLAKQPAWTEGKVTWKEVILNVWTERYEWMKSNMIMEKQYITERQVERELYEKQHEN